MPGAIDRAPDLGEPARDAGRCFVVHDEHGADAVVAIRGQPRLERRGIDAAPPGAGHHLDLEPEPPRHLGPVLRELADIEREHASPGESVLTSDASHAPLPEAGKITTGTRVWNIRFSPSSTSRPSPPNSAPR